MPPRNGAKSGMMSRFDRIVTITEPAKMPASATPTGRPIASTDPNASTRITIANARPRASVEGSSNSPRAAPPSSTWTPSTVGQDLLQRATDRARLLPVVAGDLEVGVRDQAGVVALRGDLAPRGVVVGARDRDPLPGAQVGVFEHLLRVIVEVGEGGVGCHIDVGVIRDGLDHGEQLFHGLLDLRIVDALLGTEHDRALGAGADLIVELVLEDVEAAGALEAGRFEVLTEVAADAAGDAADDEDGDAPTGRRRAVACGSTTNQGERTCGVLRGEGGRRVSRSSADDRDQSKATV